MLTTQVDELKASHQAELEQIKEDSASKCSSEKSEMQAMIKQLNDKVEHMQAEQSTFESSYETLRVERDSLKLQVEESVKRETYVHTKLHVTHEQAEHTLKSVGFPVQDSEGKPEEEVLRLKAEMEQLHTQLTKVSSEKEELESSMQYINNAASNPFKTARELKAGRVGDNTDHDPVDESFEASFENAEKFKDQWKRKAKQSKEDQYAELQKKRAEVDQELQQLIADNDEQGEDPLENGFQEYMHPQIEKKTKELAQAEAAQLQIEIDALAEAEAAQLQIEIDALERERAEAILHDQQGKADLTAQNEQAEGIREEELKEGGARGGDPQRRRGVKGWWDSAKRWWRARAERKARTKRGKELIAAGLIAAMPPGLAIPVQKAQKKTRAGGASRERGEMMIAAGLIAALPQH